MNNSTSALEDAKVPDLDLEHYNEKRTDKLVDVTSSKFGNLNNNNNNSLMRNDSCASEANIDISMDSEAVRSVSYSSDKFPPPALIKARINHGDWAMPNNVHSRNSSGLSLNCSVFSPSPLDVDENDDPGR